MGNLQVKSRCGPGVRGGCLEVLEIRRRRSVSDQRSGGGEREAEVIRLREVGSNYSYWEEQLHMREQQLNGLEVNMGE